MKLIAIAFKYFRKQPALTMAVLCTIVVASFFEGASFGMLIPLIQGMTSGASQPLAQIPFLSKLGGSFISMARAEAISLMFILIFILILVKNLFLYISEVFGAKLRFGIVRDLRTGLMDNLLEYDLSFFDTYKTGHIISNISAETERMGNFLSSVIRCLAFSGRIIAYIVILLLISWKISLVVFIFMAIVFLPVELVMRKLKKLSARVSRALADFNYKLTEILGGIRLIKLWSTEGLEKRNFEKAANEVYRFNYKSNKYMHLILPVSEVSILGLITICFLFLANTTKVDMTVMFPYIAAYLLVFARTLTQLNALNSMRSNAMTNLAAFASYEKIYDKTGKKTILNGKKTIKKFSRSIKFKNVNFSYIKGSPVLRDINIEIPAGKITAFVGASGAGKSTVVNLIGRFYDITSGDIFIDGISLKDLNLKEWRRKIGFVSQDVFLFNKSIKDNIAYGQSDISEEEVAKAAAAANAHDFIMKFSHEYGTVMGERGVKLSGGQKQRISIARSIIHNPEILILDEATSSLDTGTEKLITEAINRLTKNRTVIAIAHRLSTILHADNIIVLDKGKVVEEGTHGNLLVKDGLYKRLYDTQFNAARKENL